MSGQMAPEIKGVELYQLQRHVDERGWLYEILREDAPHFRGFGQVYIAMCRPGIIKAWHAHVRQWDHFCVIRGTAKVGLFDDREGSPTKGKGMSVVMSGCQPALLSIPPRVWHGQMALGAEESWLLNIPTKPYDRKNPDELRKPPDHFPFQWEPHSG